MEEAEFLCDRVGIIDRGRLLVVDTVANLRAAYGHEFKITCTANGCDPESQSLYGADERRSVEWVPATGVSQYNVARTNLEDVYMALTGEEEVLEVWPESHWPGFALRQTDVL